MAEVVEREALKVVMEPEELTYDEQLEDALYKLHSYINTYKAYARDGRCIDTESIFINRRD